MTERPILFSGPMVNAILEGRKSQTRRVITPQFNKTWGHGVPSERGFKCASPSQKWRDAFAVHADIPSPDGWKWLFCKFGKPGDRLWIKTGYTTRYDAMFDHTQWSVPGVGFITTRGRAYSKSGKAKRDGGHPAMFMPQWLSAELKLPVLEITDVRVQRMQDISEADAVAEGFSESRMPELVTIVTEDGGSFQISPNYVHGVPSVGDLMCGRKVTHVQLCPEYQSSTAVNDFFSTWNALNYKRGFGWDANPWVWAITFKRLEATP